MSLWQVDRINISKGFNYNLHASSTLKEVNTLLTSV